jgi:uncharacterized protein YbjQ (UPF0145 family)
MLITTTSINKDHEIIDVIFHVHSAAAKGFLGGGGLDINEAFNNAKSELAEIARDRGGNGVIGCVDGMNRQVLEIFCFGTIVKVAE